ncbi:hypothetical protein GCM10022204_20100 [Microlunatus aurantiacus]|uniref:Permease n=1 Tax=Microlunatus aurantiacus TaxID=446786 RepID=A0ABP7DDM5_9ACTN
MSESTGPAEPTRTPVKPQDGATPAAAPTSPKPAKAKRPRTPEQLERRAAVIRFTVFVVVGAVLTVLLYFLLSAFIPRWWSQSVGRQVGGRIGAGVVLGLLYGSVFTFLPLIVLAQARHRAFRWPTKVIIALVAAALTAPNLMTLGIAVGTGAAARAGNRTLDVLAPGFRQATLWGVVLGAVAAIAVVLLAVLWDRRTRELKLLRAQVDQLQKDLPPALPTSADPPRP